MLFLLHAAAAAAAAVVGVVACLLQEAVDTILPGLHVALAHPSISANQTLLCAAARACKAGGRQCSSAVHATL
jgi:hypothetical protein